MERRLAAILIADVVGYSGMMERDEAGTFERLRAHRKELAEPTIAQHNGRIFKLTGDGLLAEFGSIVDAIECAAAMQRGMADRNRDLSDGKRIDFRIGVHVGDVIVEGDDRHGDAVNIAARLQQLAEAGGICTSRAVVDQVKQKVLLAFEPRGEERLKNIAEPISVFRVRNEAMPVAQRSSLTVLDRPSIAVLPFTNMSGDAEQEYFADGIVEEIITALSRMRWLFVIARNSSFTYKGRAVDVKQVGRELGVRYVLEGSVRKAGSRIRITGQLIDATTGAHLWADRFDGEAADIFDLQDQVTESVVGAIGPKVEQAEIDRAARKPTENLDAYDYYLRGMAAYHRYAREPNTEALHLFRRAFELDPNFASAYGMAAMCLDQAKIQGWATDREKERAETIWLARNAAERGWHDAVALSAAGFALAYVGEKLEEGAALIERALVLDRNLAAAWMVSGWIKIWLGEPESGIERVQRAMRLSPQDIRVGSMHAAISYGHFIAGRYEEAIAWADSALQGRSDQPTALRMLAASCALTGRQERAEAAIRRILDANPAIRISDLGYFIPLRRPDDFARLADGLRKAGLPE